MFLEKGVLEICSKFTGKHPCRNVISRKLFCNFIEITRRYGCSPVTLLHIFRIFFTKNTSGWLLLLFEIIISLTIIVKVVTFIIAQFTWLCCSKWSGMIIHLWIRIFRNQVSRIKWRINNYDYWVFHWTLLAWLFRWKVS